MPTGCISAAREGGAMVFATAIVGSRHHTPSAAVPAVSTFFRCCISGDLSLSDCDSGRVPSTRSHQCSDFPTPRGFKVEQEGGSSAT